MIQWDINGIYPLVIYGYMGMSENGVYTPNEIAI